MSLPNYLERARKVIDDIIQMRSSGTSVPEVSEQLGLHPWQIYALTKFVKVLVTTDEGRMLEEHAEEFGFGSVGEYLMDVHNKHAAAYARKHRKNVA